MTTPEPKRFIVTPFKGQIVKVYLQNKKEAYGIVREIVIEPDYDERDGTLREIAVLDRANREYELHECDYFLTEAKIRFYQTETT